jgi:hypothetical protein
MFRAAPDRCDYLVLSDAFVVAQTATGDVRVITDRSLESVAVRERSAVYNHRIGTEEHTSAVLTMVRVQMALRNKPGGYWVAAADPDAAQHALTGHFDAGDVTRAAVLTDGAARLTEPFEVMSWPELVDVLATGSGSDLISRTRSVEGTDPRGEKWPRYKTSDDAAVAYCEIAGTRQPHHRRSRLPSVSAVS